MLRLVTYNIHHAEGADNRVDLDRVAAVVRSLEPDIVCLQEVDRSLPRTGCLDFPALLSEKLAMPVYFSPNFRFQGGEYGNATLSRLPLVSWQNAPLPGEDGLEPRGRLETVFAWQGGQVRVWNTHLGLKAEERERQVASIVRDGFPDDVIFCGDMNEDTMGRGLRLVLEALGTAQPKHDEDKPSFPSPQPVVRIDHFFAGADYALLRYEVVHTETTAVASDHLPVVAEIQWAGI